ncbi:hypothetical protein AB0F88_16630 [Streptosporangium sp. NPDC023963]|uniref:hypothetical protein n=1 Tax=Streptosporangium sp. NPDC023963 TaxID=3155608 RepID=UPI00343F9D07
MRSEGPLPAAWLADPQLTMEQLLMLGYLAGFPEGHLHAWEAIASGMPYHRRDEALRLILALASLGYAVITSPDPVAFTLCPRGIVAPRRSADE